MIDRNDPYLGGCYHTGQAYCLGYDANGELELDTKIFTTLNTGQDGGAMAALAEHQKQFDISCHVKRFIVALMPVGIIHDPLDNKYDKSEDNARCDCCGEYDRLEGEKFCGPCMDNTCDECEGQFKDCDCRYINHVHCACLCDSGDTCDEECCTSCSGCKEDDARLDSGDCTDTCDECRERCYMCDEDSQDCCCYCEECSDAHEDCGCEDEFCEEFVADTFKPMNAFARARWLSAKKKGN